jgi:hypothetical protein
MNTRYPKVYMYTKNTTFRFQCCYFNKEYSKVSKYPSYTSIEMCFKMYLL